MSDSNRGAVGYLVASLPTVNAPLPRPSPPVRCRANATKVRQRINGTAIGAALSTIKAIQDNGAGYLTPTEANSSRRDGAARQGERQPGTRSRASGATC